MNKKKKQYESTDWAALIIWAILLMGLIAGMITQYIKVQFDIGSFILGALSGALYFLSQQDILKGKSKTKRDKREGLPYKRFL